MRKFNITVNGKTYDVVVEEIGQPAAPAGIPSAPTQPLAPTAEPTPAPAPAAAPAPAEAPADSELIKAPMPGTILDVSVSVGQNISKGDVLVVLEAMKMENEIVSPKDGKVASLHVNKGDTVNSDDVLLSII